MRAPGGGRPGPRQRGDVPGTGFGVKSVGGGGPFAEKGRKEVPDEGDCPCPPPGLGPSEGGTEGGPGPRGHLLLELCCPPPAGPSTACAPGSGPPGVSPTWSCLWTGPVLGPHLYANHPWGPQPTGSRASMKSLHFPSPKLAHSVWGTDQVAPPGPRGPHPSQGLEAHPQVPGCTQRLPLSAHCLQRRPGGAARHHPGAASEGAHLTPENSSTQATVLQGAGQ